MGSLNVDRWSPRCPVHVARPPWDPQVKACEGCAVEHRREVRETWAELWRSIRQVAAVQPRGDGYGAHWAPATWVTLTRIAIQGGGMGAASKALLSRRIRDEACPRTPGGPRRLFVRYYRVLP